MVDELAIKWNFYNGQHQTTVRIDKDTAAMLDLAFTNLDSTTIQKLITDALRHYCSCGAKNNALQILERRVTLLEQSV